MVVPESVPWMLYKIGMDGLPVPLTIQSISGEIHSHQTRKDGCFCLSIASVSSSVIWCLYGPMIRLRLSGVSLHSAIARRQVLYFELGFLRLAIWSISLNVPPPWSPPSFTYTSSLDIVLLCCVSWFSMSHWSSSSVTYCGISVMVATGVCSRS